MRNHGVKKNEGIAMLVRREFHKEIHKELKSQNLSLHPRDALAQNIMRTRRVYKNNDLYLPTIRSGLQEKIRQNKVTFPHLFEKTKK